MWRFFLLTRRLKKSELSLSLFLHNRPLICIVSFCVHVFYTFISISTTFCQHLFSIFCVNARVCVCLTTKQAIHATNINFIRLQRYHCQPVTKSIKWIIPLKCEEIFDFRHMNKWQRKMNSLQNKIDSRIIMKYVCFVYFFCLSNPFQSSELSLEWYYLIANNSIFWNFMCWL